MGYGLRTPYDFTAETGLLSVGLTSSSAMHEKLRATLIAARTEAGLTQRQLADRLGRPQSFVSKYERGERRLDIVELIEIAKALGIDPAAVVAELEAIGAARTRQTP